MKRARAAVAVVVGGCLIAGAAYAANELLLAGDGEAKPAPVSVLVLPPGTFAGAHPYAPYYVVPRKRFATPSKLSRPARNKLVTQPESALQKGALAGSPQVVRLELRATSDEPVTVDAVRVKVISDARPLAGWYTAAASCDFEGVRRARIDLDRPRRPARYVDPGGGASRAPGIKLSGSNPAVIELQAATRRSRVAWTAELTVTAGGGEPQTVTVVDDDGEPFRVTSERSSQAYRPIYGISGIIGYARERGLEGC